MPWCPKCRRYQEEGDLCAFCRVEVIDSLPDLPEKRVGREGLLVSVRDENEADIIQNLLESNEIYSLRRYPGSGGYMKVYMGTPTFGVDIYVLENDAAVAREIIGVDLDGKQIEDQDNYDGEKTIKRYDIARILVAFVFGLMFTGLVLSLLGIYTN